MMNNTTTHTRVMRRIYAIWAARLLVSPLFLKLYAIAALVFGMTKYVSFRAVISNAPAWNDLGAQYAFFSTAVTHTEMATLGMLAALALCLVWAGFGAFAKKTA